MNRRPRTHNVLSAFEGLKSDYAASMPNRFRRIRTGLYGSADSHYANELQFIRVREYVRDMDRNDAVIGQLVDRAVANMTQNGFRNQPLTGDKKLDKDFTERWNDWANDPDQCDAAGESTFADMESLALRHQIIDGDVFGLPMEDGSIQMVEADRCRTPANTRKNVVHGVLLDDRRRRLEYWFSKEQLNPYDRIYKVSDMLQVPSRDPDTGARQVFHVYNAKRFSQTRGVTAFHPIFDIAGMVEDVNFAEVVRRQVIACIAFFLERTNDYATDFQIGERSRQGIDLRGEGSNTSAVAGGDDSNTGTIENVTPGLMLRGKKGEKLTGFAPNVPGDGYFQHVKFLLTIIGINVGMPLVMVLMDAGETNFSGWRGAIEQARLGFRCNQRQYRDKFHRHVYTCKVWDWIATDPAVASAYQRLGDGIFNHKWHPPGWPYIQPMQDAQADALRLENLLASPTQILAEDGNDFRDVLKQIIRDNSRAVELSIKASQRIEQRTGVKVHWRDVLNRAIPKGGKVTEPLDAEAEVGAKPATKRKPVVADDNN